MKRSMMQIYVEGSDKAVELYKKAFNAILMSSYPSDDGKTYFHAELDVYGQTLAIAESKYMMNFTNPQSEDVIRFYSEAKRNPGNTMQFCLHFGEGNADKVRQGFEVLKEDSFVLYPLGPTSFSPCMVDFIDQFGVRWCLFE